MEQKNNKTQNGYRDLEIYKTSFDLFIKTHKFSMKFPRHEMFELGSQLRRSADSVNSNIVEGYGRKVYPKEWYKFMVYSLASCDETSLHLLKINHLYPYLSSETSQLLIEYDQLGKKISSFLDYLKRRYGIV
ncbi:MAG: four helix bundle protein [Bacteroidetes bacterium B1(2017)]|nr:MAG: four helix bundle protein [Bacteroidetes bacterium B1(2017)]